VPAVPDGAREECPTLSPDKPRGFLCTRKVANSDVGRVLTSSPSPTGIFLHITSGPDNANNVLAPKFGIIVTLVVVGSLWIMTNLNDGMMSSELINLHMQH
jgi:hypothetical protein